MSQEILQSLQSYWFTDKEAKIYIACLGLWLAPGSSIARQAQENRVTVYVLLKWLCDKWVAQEIKKNWTSYFSVISPDLILQKFQTKLAMFKKALPGLIALSNPFQNLLKIQFFQWIDGLLKLYEDQLHFNQDIFSFLWTTQAHPDLKKYFSEVYIPTRVENWAYAYKILHKDAESIAFQKLDKKQFRKSLLVKDFPMWTATDITLYGTDKVWIAILDDKDLVWIIVQSQQLYDTLLALFKFVRNSIDKTKKL